ncbi:MAG: NAD(P)H-hydrate epimerase, partial [Flavobacteriales bacterium]
MKILSAAEVRQADVYTIEHEPIASIDLMERAATAAYKWIERHCDFKKRFLVFCGTGNNGGDGLVIARLLHRAGCKADAFAVRFSDRSSDDFKINEERLRKSGMVLHDIRQEEDIPHIEDDAVVIDAMFGSGLSRPVQGIAAEVILHINASGAEVLAVDIPSGLFCESNADNDRSHIVQARHTLTFQVPKLSFFFPENAPYVGDWHVIPIGLDETFITSLPSKYHYLTEEMVAGLLKKREKFDHK